MRYYVGFGLITAALAGSLFYWLYSQTNWHPYAIWVTALSGATFGIYGVDKLLATIGWGRAPENLLHLLALLGGFPGGWAGMAVFHHKTNYREHPSIWFFLILGTVGHAALAFYWFFLRN